MDWRRSALASQFLQGALVARPAWEVTLAARRDAFYVVTSPVSRGYVGSQYGETALIMAAKSGHKDLLKLLVDRGANLEARSRVSLETVPLRGGPCPGVRCRGRKPRLRGSSGHGGGPSRGAEGAGSA